MFVSALKFYQFVFLKINLFLPPPPPSLVLLLSPYPFILLSLSSVPVIDLSTLVKLIVELLLLRTCTLVLSRLLRRWSELMFLTMMLFQQSFLSKLPTSPGDECRKDLDHSAFSRHRGNMNQSKPGEAQRADWMHHMHTHAHMTKLWFVKHVATLHSQVLWWLGWMDNTFS